MASLIKESKMSQPVTMEPAGHSVTYRGQAGKPAVPKTRLVTVEPIILLLLAVQGGIITLRTQYIENRLARSYNYTLPQEDNSTTGVCSNSSTTKDPIELRIESETAQWTMYLMSASTFAPIVTALVLATLSDFVGRRPMFIVGVLGHVVASVTYFLVAYFELDLGLLVAGEAFLGVCGDTSLLLSVSFSYIADVTVDAHQGRSRRFLINDMMSYIGLGGAIVVMNIILQQTENYTLTFGIVCVPAVVAFLYTAPPCVLLETVQPRPLSGGIFKDLVGSIVRLLRENANGRRQKLLLLMSCQFIFDLIFEALFTVITIYGLAPPFCWSHTVVGLYGLIVSVSSSFVSVFSIKSLTSCMSEYSIVTLGFFSAICFLFATAIATTNIFLIFVAPALGLFRVLPTSVLKSLMSKTVNEHEQGTLFGCLAVLISIARSLSPFLLNGVYSAAVKLGYPTVPLYMSIGFLAVPILLLRIVETLPEWNPRPGYISVQD